MKTATFLPFALLAALSSAPEAALAQDEPAFFKNAAKKLNAYATVCFKNGFPRKAKATWLEILSEYDTDDEVARKSLGYRRMGRVWQRDPDFEFPEQDNLNPSVAKNLASRWSKLAKDLGQGHRDLALKLKEAGNDERAGYHLDRALRFLPGDAKAQEARGIVNFEGFAGTELEVQLLKRSRLMERAITELTEKQYDVQALPADATHPYLEKGRMDYRAVKSENFVVWGDWEEAVLREAASWAERALEFCEAAFAGCDGFPPKRGVPKAMAFCKERDTWVGLVQANHDLFGRGVNFIVENTSATHMGQGQHELRTAGVEQVETVNDLAVRWVAQGYSGFRTDGMVEGIGHAIVGMFFGRNLIFSVGQVEAKGTVSGRQQYKLLLPDMETWRELATENAWQKTGTAAARLPLLVAASFPTDGRIKAWSFCDYGMRRDPTLLRLLDRTKLRSRNENDVRAEFSKSAKVSIDEIDEGWRRFWTEDGALQQAIRKKVTPLEAVSRTAPKWLAEFNELRRRYNASEVGWSASLSTDCRMHVDYLVANRSERGPAEEHTQEPGRPGFTNEGRTFAQTALVSTSGSNPKKALASWIDIPGYRDALLNRGIDTVGLYVDGSIAVFDVERGRSGAGPTTIVAFPDNNNDQRNPVPSSVSVALLGPEVRKLLEEHGHDKAKQIGYPISWHAYGGSVAGTTCSVFVGDEPVDGVLHQAFKGNIRRSAARGMVVFYPFQPLKRGAEVRVEWNYGGGTTVLKFMTR